MEQDFVLGKRELYITSMRPALNKKAIFSDMTAGFVCPMEPEPYGKVIITLRTGKNNVDYVFLHGNGESHMMMRTETDNLFDFYRTEVTLDAEPYQYYFEIVTGHLKCYYERNGLVKAADPRFCFKLIPGFKTPEWAKGAVMYQIYADRFYNGDRSNDVLTDEYHYLNRNSTHVDDWDKYPDCDGVREFYGGDLQGVIDKMDYLQDLGIQVIYFNPLFVSPSNHKYDIQDYDHIDPHLGRIVYDEGDLLAEGDNQNIHASRYINRVTDSKNLEASNELFATLVQEAHRRGMRVILDGVFNHCGSFNKWMDAERIYEQSGKYPAGAFVAKDSPYHDYFKFFSEEGWPYCANYDGWWGHKTLPKLNYSDRALYDYILSIAAKWVSPPYNADGWRLDVAADLGTDPEMNHRFWKDFRRVVKEANPDAIILAEHYGNPESWLQGDEWDSVMNYDAFMEPVTWFLTGMQKHSDDFRGDLLNNADAFIHMMTTNGVNLPSVSAMVSMNELSNHDHSRFLTRTNRTVGRVAGKGPEAASIGINPAVMREAVCIQMTWPGAPTVYYGDEAGVCGWTDPDNRRTYPWGHEDMEMLNFHKDMIRIHKENPELSVGSLLFLHREEGVLCYGRFNETERSIVIINNTEEYKELQLEVWPLGFTGDCDMQELIHSDKSGYQTPGAVCPMVAGLLQYVASPMSATVLKARQ